MKLSQATMRIILVLTGVALVAFLYAFPKDVVENDQQKSTSTTNLKSNQTDTRTREFSEAEIAVLNKVRSLKKNYNASDNNEIKGNFADSIVFLFNELSLFDSSLTFLESHVETVPGYESMIRAGNNYYLAFSLSPDGAKKKKYGEKALKYYNKVLKIFPTRTDIETRKAVVMVYTETPPMKGINLLKKITRQDPMNIEAWMSLGEFQMRVGKVDKAITSFKAILKYYPDHEYAIIRLGDCYAMADNDDKAVYYYAKAEEKTLDPSIKASLRKAIKSKIDPERYKELYGDQE